MSQLSIHNKAGKETETMEFPDGLFGDEVNTDVIHQAVIMYQANNRQGTASTKERGAVSGGGKKPFRQKGTGRARAGSNRSPLWHGGGVVFGPHPRDFSYSVPRKVKAAALRESINAKLIAKDVFCVEQFDTTYTKTKDFAKWLKNLNLEGKVLALLDKDDENIARVSRNIPYFNLKRVSDVTAYDVLKSKKLLLTKAALKSLLERIQ